MKKLKLIALEIGNNEFLTRDQLRAVTGGCQQLGGFCTIDADCCAGNTCNTGICSFGCGHNISCAGKDEFAPCGTSGTCACQAVSGSLYCRSAP